MAKLAKCEGELVLKDGQSSAIEFYEEIILLSDEIKDIPSARQLIQKGMIEDILRKKHKNFKRMRTCQVLSLEDSTEKVETSDIESLFLKAINLGCVPENIGNYKNPVYKKRALERAIEAFEQRVAKKKGGNVQDLGYVD